MYKKVAELLICSLILFSGSCGSGGGLSLSSITGTWQYSTTECDGDELSIAGVSIQVEINSENVIGTYSTDDCTASLSYSYTIDGNSLITAFDDSTCDPNPCDQPITVNGVPTTLTCPDDFNGSGGISQIEISGDVGTATYESNGLNCIDTYIKQ